MFEKLGINKKVIDHTKTFKKPKNENVKTIIPPKEDYNFQMDFLELPKTKQGYNRLLVMVDLATDEVDFEPTKSKTAESALKAMKAIFQRPYLNKPYASIKTDSGTEWLGVVRDYLYNESILHSTSEPGRHKQTGNVESANRQISTVLNMYMNSKTIEKDAGEYNEWTDILPQLRKEINIFRKKPLQKNKLDYISTTYNEPVFKAVDYVYRKLDRPQDARGFLQPTEKKRAGDITLDFIPRRIVKVLDYPRNVRYMLYGLPHVSYTKEELVLTTDRVVEDDYQEIRKIIDTKLIKKKRFYLVWWNGERKSQATWEPETQLLDDDLADYIEFYKQESKKKGKSKL